MYFTILHLLILCISYALLCTKYAATLQQLKLRKKSKIKTFFENISRYSSAMPRTSTSTSPERSQLATRGSYPRDTNHSTRLDEASTPMNNPAGTRDRRADRSNYRY